MAQQGGAGNQNPDIFQTIEIKASAAQIVLDSTSANTTTIQDSATSAITLTLPDTTAGLVPDNGDILTGVWDFGGATSLELPNSAAPVVNADGEIAMDTTVTDFSTGLVRFFLNEEQAIVSMPAAQFVTPTDGHVIAYNATNDEFELVASAGGGNTLDGAYDQGGAGAGRTIDADSGAVEITVSDTDNNVGFIVNQNDTTNNPGAVTFTNTGTGAVLTLTGAGGLVSEGKTVRTPKTNQALVAANAIDVSDATMVRVSGSGGAVTLTSTPTIADGTDGQIIMLRGTDDTNTLTIQDEGQLASSNLHLKGGNNFTLGLGDMIQLVFDADDSAWVECWRSDN